MIYIRFPEVAKLAQCDYHVPKSVIDAVLALPHEPLIAELDRASREIMQTVLEEESPFGWEQFSPLLHFLVILGHLEAPVGFERYMDLMRKEGPWLNYHFGDYLTEDLHYLLGARCGRFHLPAIRAFLMQYKPQEDLWAVAAYSVGDLLTSIAKFYPELKPETDAIVREILEYYAQIQEVSDDNDFINEATAALGNYCIHYQMGALLPLLETLFQQGRVWMGDWDDFRSEYAANRSDWREDKTKDIYQFFKEYNAFQQESREEHE
jgi:hypothetical protein